MSTLLHAPLSLADPESPALHQQALDLADSIHGLLKALPSGDRYDLKVRLGQAASAVPGNIAESEVCTDHGDRLCNLSLAKAALAQLEIHLLLAVRSGSLTCPGAQDALRQIDEISRTLAERSTEIRLQLA